MNFSTSTLALSTGFVVAAGFAFAPAAQAEVLLDFGDDVSFRGVAVTSPDSNGNTWNSVRPGVFYPDLLDTNGDPTTIDFGFSTGAGTDSFNGPAGATSNPVTAAEITTADGAINNAALGNLGIAEAAIDFVASSGGVARFEIQQLDPTKLYDITFFGSHKFNADNTTVYRIYSDNTYTTLVDSATLEVGVGSAHNEDTVALISAVAPQDANILYVEFEGATGNSGYLNALSVAEFIPEPASASLASVGALLMLRRRRG